ncbi:MAG: PilZ domain-containing protein [Acidobacteriia bacterium]|nr:PilZ domain-containing protein [Terriglobia bacterium]
MATRSSLRRRVVLPVTIIRNDGTQRQLAHTLDVTSDSARLAGLYLDIEPGEVIEILRGTARTKFRVFWVGAASTPLAGQIGTQCIVPGKNIWGVALPPDEPDNLNNPEQFRTSDPVVHSVHDADERRGHSRLECNAGASIQAPGIKHPIYARITDISEGGVYVTTATVLPQNTSVRLQMNIEGFLVEMPGVVKSSDAAIGMGIGFLNVAQEKQKKLALAIQGLKRKMAQSQREEPLDRLVIAPFSIAG